MAHAQALVAAHHWTEGDSDRYSDGVDAEIRERVADVLSGDARLVWAYVFGSAARGGPHRDVDVAVMPRDGALTSLVDLGGLQIELARAAGTDVDLIDLRRAPLPLLGSILSDRTVLLDRRGPERRSWEACTWSRWLDFEPSLRRYSEIRAEKLAQRGSSG